MLKKNVIFFFRIYGFYDECKRRYNIKLWKTFTDCFNCLPIGMYWDKDWYTSVVIFWDTLNTLYFLS